MDQIQEYLDPEVAGQVIALLNKKVASLRSENADLQSRLGESTVKTNEDDTQRLLDEIERLKAELQRRPAPEEVASLEEKLKTSETFRRKLEQEKASLNAKLEESESGRLTAVAFGNGLKKEVEGLCNTLNEMSAERDRAVLQLKSSPAAFDFRKFLNGEMIPLRARPPPALMSADETRRFREVIKTRGEQFFFPIGITWAGEAGGCVVPMPSILYNAKTEVAEAYRYKPVPNHKYHFCGTDERNHNRTYHGVYRCVAVTPTDWEHLASIDDRVADRFLDRIIVEKGFARSALISFILQLYRTGTLKVDFAVFLYDHFDATTLEQVLPTEKFSMIANMSSSHVGAKRPKYEHPEQAEGSVKRQRL